MAAAILVNDSQAFELRITRIFNAPRDLVWEVWTDAAHARQWMGPRPYPAIAMEQDVRVGGAWSLTLKGLEDGLLLKQSGVFLEIVPKQRVVYTLKWGASHPAHGADMLVTVTFADEGAGKTRMDFLQQGLPSQAERDSHDEGWSSAFDRFEDLIRVASEAGPTNVWLYPEDDPVILGARLFNAPRELVFECFTKAEHMAKWWGPKRCRVRVEHYDVRPGGKWRIHHSSEDEGEYAFFGEFVELHRPDLFVWTFGFAAEGGPEVPPAEEVYSFTERDGKTMLVSLTRFPDMATRDSMRAIGMEAGAAETYERLDEHLAALR